MLQNEIFRVRLNLNNLSPLLVEVANLCSKLALWWGHFSQWLRTPWMASEVLAVPLRLPPDGLYLLQFLLSYWWTNYGKEGHEKPHLVGLSLSIKNVETRNIHPIFWWLLTGKIQAPDALWSVVLCPPIDEAVTLVSVLHGSQSLTEPMWTRQFLLTVSLFAKCVNFKRFYLREGEVIWRKPSVSPFKRMLDIRPASPHILRVKSLQSDHLEVSLEGTFALELKGRGNKGAFFKLPVPISS